MTAQNFLNKKREYLSPDHLINKNVDKGIILYYITDFACSRNIYVSEEKHKCRASLLKIKWSTQPNTKCNLKPYIYVSLYKSNTTR